MKLLLATHRHQLTFLLLLVVSGSLLAYAMHAPTPAFVGRPVIASHLGFGSPGTSNVGWLIPSNTLFTTSYTTNQSVSGFLLATLNVFNFEIQPGTVLQLGFYFNGQLVTNRTYDLGNIYQNHASGHAGRGWVPASMIGRVGPTGLANFTMNMLGPNVGRSGITTLPAGTVVTVTAWTNFPIWVQVDLTAAAHSYETSGVTSSTPPPKIRPGSGAAMAPFTLSVGLESQ